MLEIWKLIIGDQGSNVGHVIEHILGWVEFTTLGRSRLFSSHASENMLGYQNLQFVEPPIWGGLQDPLFLSFDPWIYSCCSVSPSPTLSASAPMSMSVTDLFLSSSFTFDSNRFYSLVYHSRYGWWLCLFSRTSPNLANGLAWLRMRGSLGVNPQKLEQEDLGGGIVRGSWF